MNIECARRTIAPMPIAHIAESETSYPLAVIMERVSIESRWATEMWQVAGVVRDNAPRGSAERIIVDQQKLKRYLFPGYAIRLMRDEAEGYYLNLTSPQPKVFVLWRMHDELAKPEMLTASYNEGTRWADSGESVDGVALPAELLAWIGEFVEQHYAPEPRKPKRYASNKDRGRMGGGG